jgi:hypothetical protein
MSTQPDWAPLPSHTTLNLTLIANERRNSSPTTGRRYEGCRGMAEFRHILSLQVPGTGGPAKKYVRAQWLNSDGSQASCARATALRTTLASGTFRPATSRGIRRVFGTSGTTPALGMSFPCPVLNTFGIHAAPATDKESCFENSRRFNVLS